MLRWIISFKMCYLKFSPPKEYFDSVALILLKFAKEQDVLYIS